MRKGAYSVAAGLFVVFVACHDDDHAHGHNEFPACKEISSACHGLDTGSGKPHECHELAHDAKTEATCTAKKAECLAACPATDGGSPDGAGADATASEAGNDATVTDAATTDASTSDAAGDGAATDAATD